MDSTTLHMMQIANSRAIIRHDSLVSYAMHQPESIALHHDFAVLGCGAFFFFGMLVLARAISRLR